jgi:hypothetical protein
MLKMLLPPFSLRGEWAAFFCLPSLTGRAFEGDPGSLQLVAEALADIRRLTPMLEQRDRVGAVR